MKKFGSSIKKKIVCTEIKFVSENKYKWLINQNKVEKGTSYFIDNSLNDMNGVKNEN